MPTTYAYKVRDRAGKLLSGEMVSDDTSVVASRLRQQGYVPISIDKKAGPGVKREIAIPGITNRIKLKEIAIFSRQFAVMINSGLTLIRSLAILAEQTENPQLATIIGQVRRDIETGSSLSQSLGRHPKAFNQLYISMIRAGESGGSLDRTLSELAAIIEKQVELRGKIRSALAYPVSVLSLVTVILVAMLVFIVPIFKSMYASLGGTLPAPTLLLVDISDLMVKAAPFMVLGAIGAVLLYRRWVKTVVGRTTRDRLILKVPVFGGLIRKTAMSRFASTLSTLLSSGVPVLECLEITADSVGNMIVANGVHAISEGARRGDPLTKALHDHPIFPPMVVQMMAVGEETGALDSLLAKVSDFFEDEVNRTVETLTSLLEPLLICVLGSAVGAMVISLYLPMFNIIKLVGKNN